MGEYVGRIALAGLSWPLPPELDDDAALERLLFPDDHRPVSNRPEPDWAWVHTELQRRHVTKMLLCEVGPPGIEPSVTVSVQGAPERTAAFSAHFSGSPDPLAVHTDGPAACKPVLRAAPGLRNLPPLEAEVFVRATAVVAARAARGGASEEDLGTIVARGSAQAAALVDSKHGT